MPVTWKALKTAKRCQFWGSITPLTENFENSINKVQLTEPSDVFA